MVLEELLEKRDAAISELTELSAPVKDEESGEDRDPELTPEQEQRSSDLLAEVDDLDGRIEEVKKVEQRNRKIAEARELVRSNKAEEARVEFEPPMYGEWGKDEGSPHSFVRDFVLLNSGPQWGIRDAGAQERMAVWGHQMERELANNSKAGKAVERQLREVSRTESGVESRRVLDEARQRGRVALEDKEQRNITTGGGATATGTSNAAAFVTPVFYVSDYAPYREFGGIAA